MEEEKDTAHSTRGSEEWKTRIERCKTEKWERRKRLADALIRFVERVTDGERTATDGELHALPGVADVCRRLL